MNRNGNSLLIGHTGFVGGSLNRSHPFPACANSSNIGEFAGRSFDLVVCAGVSAVKWLANKEPENDKRGIDRLTSVLATIEAKEFVLISTVDVYPSQLDEPNEDTAIDLSILHAYGRHRLELERWCQDRFGNLRVVRLPALFGDGLKKNVVFDLLNNNQTGAINPAAAFQWYPLRRLPNDIALTRERKLPLINLVTEPIRTSDIVTSFFPSAQVGAEQVPAPRYDLRTKHAGLFGGANGYVMNGEAVLAELGDYIRAERGRSLK